MNRPATNVQLHKHLRAEWACKYAFKIRNFGLGISTTAIQKAISECDFYLFDVYGNEIAMEFEIFSFSFAGFVKWSIMIFAIYLLLLGHGICKMFRGFFQLGELSIAQISAVINRR